MVVKPEDLVENLSSIDSSVRLKAVRDVKNQIIGNRNKKLSFIKLGAVPKVVEILACDTEAGLLVQSAAAVASFAYGVEDGAHAVHESGAVKHLLRTLTSPDERVVEACVRSLKMICQSSYAPLSELFDAEAIHRLVDLLSASYHCVAEVAARVLARCCASKEQQLAILAAGGVTGMLHLLTSSRASQQEASLDALAAVVADNATVAATVLRDGSNTQGAIVALLRDRSPRTRFLACTALVHLCANCREGMQPSAEAVQRQVLPVLVKLLGEAGVREEVPHLLGNLFERSEELQRLASDADAIGKLADFLHDDNASMRLKEGTLRALGTLCMPEGRDDSRQQLVQARVLTPIVRAMGDSCPAVRAAACHCLRSLSRSVKSLRSTLLEADVALPLFRLVSDPSHEVQANASATLCNMLLDFSPVKEVMLQAGAVRQLVALTHSSEPDLRLNAMWALQNLVYGAEPEVKASVRAELPWLHAAALLRDDDPAVREKTLTLLRNLCFGKAGEVKRTVQWSGGQVMAMVRQQLDPASPHDGIRQAGLYTICNIATGEEEHRDQLLAQGMDKLVLAHLSDACEQVRVAAVWCVINLLWREGGYRGAAKRIVLLQEAGIERQLQGMTGDESLDVRERVKTALDLFRLSVLSD